jgi:hypothetical protein
MEDQDYPQPLPPSVRKVFEDFLHAMKADPQINETVVKRMTSTLLEKQRVDAESLRAALFGDGPETP